jgi:WD40 repeat protein
VGQSDISVWDIATGSELFVIGSTPNPSDHKASFSPDLRTILINDRSSLRLFEYESGKARCTIGPWSSHNFLDAKFDPAGRRIVAVFSEIPVSHSLPRIQIWDTDSCQQMQGFAATMTTFARASFSADGMSIVAIVSNPPPALLWDARSGLDIRRFEPAGVKYVHDVLLSPDGRRLLTRSSFYHGTDIF